MNMDPVLYGYEDMGIWNIVDLKGKNKNLKVRLSLCHAMQCHEVSIASLSMPRSAGGVEV
jgi:hypothetical protein